VPFLLAERAIKTCSLDARSKGQPRPLLLKRHRELEGPRSTAAVESSSLPCLVGIEMGKRVHLLSFTIRWSIVPARNRSFLCLSDRTLLCGIGWPGNGPSWPTSARCCRTLELRWGFLPLEFRLCGG
jgi:hypothetical protein